MLLLFSFFILHLSDPEPPQDNPSDQEEFTRKRRALLDKERALYARRREIQSKRRNLAGNSEEAKNLQKEEDDIQAEINALREEQQKLLQEQLSSTSRIGNDAFKGDRGAIHRASQELAEKNRKIMEKRRILMRKRLENPDDPSLEEEERKIQEELDAVSAERQKLRESFMADLRARNLRQGNRNPQ
jgi:hypothetical protein